MLLLDFILFMIQFVGIYHENSSNCCQKEDLRNAAARVCPFSGQYFADIILNELCELYSTGGLDLIPQKQQIGFKQFCNAIRHRSLPLYVMQSHGP
jgi:hypothetical protein